MVKAALFGVGRETHATADLEIGATFYAGFFTSTCDNASITVAMAE